MVYPLIVVMTRPRQGGVICKNSWRAFLLALEEKRGILGFDALAFAFTMAFDRNRFLKFRLRAAFFTVRFRPFPRWPRVFFHCCRSQLQNSADCCQSQLQNSADCCRSQLQNGADCCQSQPQNSADCCWSQLQNSAD